MSGTLAYFAYMPEEIYRIKEALDAKLIADAIAKNVVTKNNWIVRDIMPNTDFGDSYYDYEEWENVISLTQHAHTKAIDVSLDSQKLIGFYGALGPSTQGVVAVRLQEGDAKVLDEWQVQKGRMGTYTDDTGRVFQQGFLDIVLEDEQIVYDKKSNIVVYYYGIETAAVDDTTVLLGRVVEPVGKTAMGAGAQAKTIAGLLPWYMTTPRMFRDKIHAVDRELVRRALEQGVVEAGNYVIRDILPLTDFGTSYYAYEKWTSYIEVAYHAWKTMINTDLDGDKLIGLYGYSGPDDNITGLRFGVGTAQTKDIWMVEQCRKGEIYQKTSASNAFQLANLALARTPIIYNGEDTVKVEAYGSDNAGASGNAFTGILHGRVIEPKGRKIGGEA